MFKNYIKVGYRNLTRQKSFAFINITGLAVGLTCSMLIGLYLLNEVGYDRFHKKADRIYRVILEGKLGSNFFKGPVTCAPMAAALMRDFPEVESATRLYINGNRCVHAGNKILYEDNFLYTDSTFFAIFDFKFIKGVPSKALVDTNSAVITSSAAKKYFGNENPVGKKFRILNSDFGDYVISAVIEDMPVNSHFHFDFICSLKAISYSNSIFWLSNNNYTYFTLKNGADPKQVERKFPELVNKYVLPQIMQITGSSAEDMLNGRNRWSYSMQKLTDIHLRSNMDYEIETNGSITFVYIFFIVALFILIIACINFVNLSTARSMNRAKEVGFRKALGSGRLQLIFQFLTESVFLCFIAVIMALFLLELFIPSFNYILGLKINYDLVTKDYLIPGIVIFTLIVGIISGSYPAFYLSRFVPVDVLKGNINKKTKTSKLRNVLVIFQFCISMIIILGTITVYYQLRYLQNIKLGYDKERVIVIERTDPIRKNIKSFMQELKSSALIEEVTLSNQVPGRIYASNGFNLEGSPLNETFLLSVFSTDCHYQKAMGMELLKGRFFSDNFALDSLSVVINETAAKYLGLKEVVGKRLVTLPTDPRQKLFLTIIGVVKDFHYESLHKSINPVLIYLSNGYYDGYITVRISKGNNLKGLQFIKNTWHKYSKSAPLTYFHFSKEFNKLLKADYQVRRLMSIFSVLAIFIACLGLFGLVSYNTEKRSKEIGIRKVMGSSVMNIIGTLSFETLVLVTIAALFAIPVAVYLINLWLNGFAYHVGIHPSIFVLAGFLTLLISFITIIYQTLKAANRNPVEALRYE
jgi:putative ABC transport system permease protein